MKTVSIIGTSKAFEEELLLARKVGFIFAKKGYAVISGGLGGVMEAAFIGAKEAGGLTIGIIPTYSKKDANPYCDVTIPTGLGHGRNVVVAASGDVVVSIGGEYGTMSEIAIALKLGKTVISFKAPFHHENNFLDEVEFLKKLEDFHG